MKAFFQKALQLNFIEEKTLIAEPGRLESRWRSSNDIYLLVTSERSYVLKRINQSTWNEDIEHQDRLSKAYTGFPPGIHIKDGRSSEAVPRNLWLSGTCK